MSIQSISERLRCLVLISGLIGLPIIGIEAQSAELQRDVGLRYVLAAASGKPANDIPGYGLYGHFPWRDRWLVGWAVDRFTYDFEEPARIAGITQQQNIEPIDVLAESTTVSMWAERILGSTTSRTQWFAGGGLGLSFIDVPDATGPRQGGGTFNIRTDAKEELIVTALAGVRRHLGSNWAVEFALRVDQHFAKWESIDQISGARGSIGDYNAVGVQLGFSRRF